MNTYTETSTPWLPALVAPSYAHRVLAAGSAGNAPMGQGTGVFSLARIRDAKPAAPPRGERH